MQDRPDLIESELSGLAFDSLQQVFKAEHLEVMFKQPIPPPVINEDVHVFIDPAAGGPYSDYAILSVTRQKGMITVRRAPRVERGEAPLEPILKYHLVIRLHSLFSLLNTPSSRGPRTPLRIRSRP